MPGYDTESVIFQQPELKHKYTCPECNLLLRDAVQPSCGHWLCQNCADIIIHRENEPCCPRENCGEPFTTEDDETKLYFPDRFVRKDVLSLFISCKFRDKGCVWEGTIGGLQDHLMKCDYGSTQCKLCHKSLRYVDMETHKTNCPKAAKRCPLSALGCTSNALMTVEELDEHLDFSKREHLELVVEEISRVKSMVQGSTRALKAPRAQPEGRCDSGFESFGTSQLDVVEKDCAVTLKKSNLPRVVVKDTIAPLGPAQLAERKMPAIFNEEVAKIQSDLKRELKFKDDEIASLKSTVQKLEKAMRSKNADFEDRDFRLSLIENSNYDGSMVWKIPQFKQRMTDAQSGKYTSIFSLPFYTGRYGYKMCLRLYILGDGIGKGSYMSLFFVLMKGEFDNILTWPFTHKVTFKLINQGNGRDVVDTFQPDPMSTSFRKPRSDMNIASGCPRLVSHDSLQNGGFIVDDTVFIKCNVDTATIKHP